MIIAKIIDRDRKEDINIPNQPFKLFGLMLPSYMGGKWDHTEIVFPPENHTEMCFPDENYDYDEMIKEHIFIGAYDGDTCVGLAIMRHDMFKYMYLYDLKVNTEYRSKGVGKMLIDECKKVAKDNGYIGVYTQG